MNPNPCKGLSVDSLTRIAGAHNDVNSFEASVIELCHQACREFYAEAFSWLQEQWLQTNAEKYVPHRWRTIRLLTPFGEVELPVRVVRRRGVDQGGYLTLSKTLLQPKATRLLSPAMEKQALQAASQQNYRPAARSLGQWIEQPVSHWMVWRCVQHHGRHLGEQLQRDWWPQAALRPESAKSVKPILSELDSGWIKRQHRGRTKAAQEPSKPQPSRGFFMHLAVHYTGRERRYAKPGSTSAKLSNKTLFASAGPMRHWAPQAKRYRNYHYGLSRPGIVLSDGDEGLERQRERYFADDVWLLDRWHVDQRLRALCGFDDPNKHLKTLRRALYRADSEELLQSLANIQGDCEAAAFAETFGYILGNREGIDAWRELPAGWKKSHGRRLASVKPSTGGVEKNIEVFINRRFKRQGRSWNPARAGYLLNLRWLMRDPRQFNHWWCQSALKRTLNPTQPALTAASATDN